MSNERIETTSITTLHNALINHKEVHYDPRNAGWIFAWKRAKDEGGPEEGVYVVNTVNSNGYAMAYCFDSKTWFINEEGFLNHENSEKQVQLIPKELIEIALPISRSQMQRVANRGLLGIL